MIFNHFLLLLIFRLKMSFLLIFSSKKKKRRISILFYLILQSPVKNSRRGHVELRERIVAKHDAADEQHFGRAQELGEVEFPCDWRVVLAHDLDLRESGLNHLRVLLERVSIAARITFCCFFTNTRHIYKS